MPFCALLVLYAQNTQVLTVTGLKDIITEQFLNSATVSATLYDEHNNPDPILTGITLVYVPASNGTYRGTVPATFNPELGGGYNLKLTAEQGGVQSLFTIPTKVALRTE